MFFLILPVAKTPAWFLEKQFMKKYEDNALQF